jgi:hypothetical protein
LKFHGMLKFFDHHVSHIYSHSHQSHLNHIHNRFEWNHPHLMDYHVRHITSQVHQFHWNQGHNCLLFIMTRTIVSRTVDYRGWLWWFHNICLANCSLRLSGSEEIEVVKRGHSKRAKGDWWTTSHVYPSRSKRDWWSEEFYTAESSSTTRPRDLRIRQSLMNISYLPVVLHKVARLSGISMSFLLKKWLWLYTPE